MKLVATFALLVLFAVNTVVLVPVTLVPMTLIADDVSRGPPPTITTAPTGDTCKITREVTYTLPEEFPPSLFYCEFGTMTVVPMLYVCFNDSDCHGWATLTSYCVDFVDVGACPGGIDVASITTTRCPNETCWEGPGVTAFCSPTRTSCGTQDLVTLTMRLVCSQRWPCFAAAKVSTFCTHAPACSGYYLETEVVTTRCDEGCWRAPLNITSCSGEGDPCHTSDMTTVTMKSICIGSKPCLSRSKVSSFCLTSRQPCFYGTKGSTAIATTRCDSGCWLAFIDVTTCFSTTFLSSVVTSTGFDLATA